VTPVATSTTAKVKVNGTSYSVVIDDKVPGGNPAFTISSVTTGDVTFTLLNGTTKSGKSSVTVNLGETVKVPLDDGSSYTLSVTSIGTSGGGSSTSGHTISVTNITETNGTAMATIEVDGKTYSDKKEGAVFSTPWGEIKVIRINASAQTVTLMHGDQTITLHAGQVVAK
jgi:predicted RNA-binding protein with TRAM domain